MRKMKPSKTGRKAVHISNNSYNKLYEISKDIKYEFNLNTNVSALLDLCVEVAKSETVVDGYAKSMIEKFQKRKK